MVCWMESVPSLSFALVAFKQGVNDGNVSLIAC